MKLKHPEDPPDPLWDETRVRKHIKALFDWRGWRTSHTYRARSPKGQWLTPTDVGFPDLVCLRPPSLVVLEVKSVGASTAKDRQREQNIWLGGFAQVPGCEAYQVNAADWPALVDLARDGCEVTTGMPLGVRIGEVCYRVPGFPLWTPEHCKRDSCEGPHVDTFAKREETA